MLPESRKPESRKPDCRQVPLAALNPLRPLAWLAAERGLVPIAAVFFFFAATRRGL